MNAVQLLVNITRDIELKYTASGMAIANFGGAQNKKVKNQQGGYDDKANFFDFTAFGKTAENINQYFRKGSKILISGELDYQSWTDQNGGKRSKVAIIINNFDFIDKKEGGQQQGGYNAPQQQQQGGYQQPQNQGQNTYQAPQQQQQYQAPQQQQRPQQQSLPDNLPAIDIDEDEIPF